ncbi:hypothetical protein RND81_05G169400 [Saponaria officinalis]|uniref:High mobility group B protein 15 n=1 Tax=Saponaria officinalis TaxID=3572 RepID=A0AAW1KZ06_SAPOF
MLGEGRGLGVSGGSGSYNQYPAPLANYDQVVADPRLFITTLEKLHSVMGTKFMIPIIGGRDLDLHKLFVEVTSRGGVDKILKEKRWKEVTSTFNFPSTATNASFVLRKYYNSLLQTYEQIYYFKMQGCGPSSTGGALQSSDVATGSVHGMPKTSPFAAYAEQPRANTVEFVSEAAGNPVIGVIDGKFDGGYLVTVRIGKDTLKGVLYQAAPAAQVYQAPQPSNVNSSPKSGLSRRRKRRRKSEMRKRDPSHPKPNRSGYNFFFAEQHARLKPLHPGKDREISRMIGELWNNLQDTEKAVYQEKAVKDKERYRIEMEDYRGRLRGDDQVISDAVPIQQRFPYFNVSTVEADVKNGSQATFSGTPEIDSDLSKSETEDDESLSETETSLAVGDESANAGVSENSADAGGDFQIVQEDDKHLDDSPSEGDH